MALTLHVSANTVQDHFKSIFAKVGVRSRNELVARVVGEHYCQHFANVIGDRPNHSILSLGSNRSGFLAPHCGMLTT